MRRVGILIVCLFIALSGVFAQEKPAAILEYFDNEGEISLSDKDGFPIEELFYGMELIPGTTIKTRKTFAEIQLKPNGSIIKISQNTEFRIEGLQGAAGSKSNDFAVFTGKIRTIAASVAGNAYTVRTPTAVCGVRGTDFGIEVLPGVKNSVFLKEGKVEFTRNTGESIFVGAGEIADALSEMFSPSALSPADLQGLFSDIEFFRLDPASVPGRIAEQQPPAEEEVTEEAEPEPTDVVETEPAPVEPQVLPPAGETPEAPAAAVQNKILDGFFAFMSEKLGMEMGSVTINETTYAKFILQPVITLGKLRAGLYLPVIYTNDLFDPSSWYHPEGNDEWSFGFDQHDDAMAMALDFTTDLMLKIRFIEYGRQRDPFFFKVGNVSNVTIGHGSIVGNYANDADFPVIRKIGFNLGIDNGKAGFESMVNDLSRPEIFALRFFLRPAAPVFKLAIGFTLGADINPAGDLPDGDAAAEADPLFLNAGLDLDLPIIETNPLSIILFADVAGMIPYFRNDFGTDGGSPLIASGLNYDAVYNDEAENFPLRNYGAMAGVFGRLFVLNYRMDFRLFDGIFKPGFYGAAYDRLRGQYAQELVSYLSSDTSAAGEKTMGVYGEAGFSLFKLDLNAGYMWPWAFDEDGEMVPSDEDYLQVSLTVPRGLVPVVDVYGSVSYSRTKFLPTILSGETEDGVELTLFDENTVLKGELVFGIIPTLDIVASVSSSVVMNGPEMVYGENGKPKIAPSIGIETRIHF